MMLDSFTKNKCNGLNLFSNMKTQLTKVIMCLISIYIGKNLIGKITDPCHLNLILFISFIITEPSNSICDRVPYTYCRTQSMVRRTSPIFSDR